MLWQVRSFVEASRRGLAPIRSLARLFAPSSRRVTSLGRKLIRELEGVSFLDTMHPEDREAAAQLKSVLNSHPDVQVSIFVCRLCLAGYVWA